MVLRTAKLKHNWGERAATRRKNSKKEEKTQKWLNEDEEKVKELFAFEDVCDDKQSNERKIIQDFQWKIPTSSIKANSFAKTGPNFLRSTVYELETWAVIDWYLCERTEREFSAHVKPIFSSQITNLLWFPKVWAVILILWSTFVIEVLFSRQNSSFTRRKNMLIHSRSRKWCDRNIALWAAVE